MKKIAAGFMLTAVLSLGAAVIPAMAAEGWSGSGNNWEYYDAYGNRVYNEWKRGGDGEWRYLDGDGYMAVNAWVDNDYYVDDNGRMLEETWLKLVGDDGDYEWYYFTGSGKMIADNWKKIDDKWYHFDNSGRVEMGWILDDMYYTGEDGVMRTGWQKLPPPDDYDREAGHVTPGFGSGTGTYGEDGEYWFYFGTNGKKFVPGDSSSGDYGIRKIDGIYYCFSEDGAMQTGWRNVRSGSGDSIEDFMYFDSDGKARIGWYSIEPPAELDGYEEAVEWFYFMNNGKPRCSDTEELRASDLVKLNGKTYLFNRLGNPVYGLKKVYVGSGEEDWTAYYFGNRDKSCVQSGKMKIEEDDGNKSEFYFSENGRGISGVKDGHLYYKGKLQYASDGQKYVCYRVDGKNYVVNSSGKVMKNANVKNSDDVKFTTSSTGTLVKADDDTDIESYVTEPTEPYCVE